MYVRTYVSVVSVRMLWVCVCMFWVNVLRSNQFQVRAVHQSSRRLHPLARRRSQQQGECAAHLPPVPLPVPPRIHLLPLRHPSSLITFVPRFVPLSRPFCVPVFSRVCCRRCGCVRCCRRCGFVLADKIF